MSIFDNIVKQESTKSLFDGIVEGAGVSLFDGVIEGASSGSVFDGIVESKTAAASATDWDDRMARTMELSESLLKIRDQHKN